MKLTKAERIAIEACLNYDDRASQLSDNYSNGDPTTIAEALKKNGLEWNKHQVAGVIGSLANKGLIFFDRGHDASYWNDVKYNPDDICWLTEKCVNIYFDIKENEMDPDDMGAPKYGHGGMY